MERVPLQSKLVYKKGKGLKLGVETQKKKNKIKSNNVIIVSIL